MSFWSYWYFHIPNYVLAAVMYTLIGRLLLGFFVPENWDNYIWRGFRLVTDPVVRVVRAITPDVIAQPGLLVFAALWMMVLRVALFGALARSGLMPLAGQGG